MGKVNQVSVPDEDFIRVCTEAVQSFCKENFKYGRADENTCRARAYEAYKTAYRSALGHKRGDALKAEQQTEMDGTYRRLQSRIHQSVREIILRFASKEKALSIRKTTAGAIMAAALSEAGFTNVYSECQCYRIKATVRIRKYTAKLVVKYKDIFDGKADEYVRDFKETLLRLESAPYEVKICK